LTLVSQKTKPVTAPYEYSHIEEKKKKKAPFGKNNAYFGNFVLFCAYLIKLPL